VVRPAYSSSALALLVWVGFKVHEAASAHALGQGFLEPDDLPGGDVSFSSRDDEPNIAEAMHRLWGSATWPPAGKAPRPPPAATGGGLGFGVGLLTFLLCAGVGLTLTLRTPHGGANGKFLLQFQALVYAISWRHTHQRSIVMHSIRIAIPALMLMMINRMQSWLLEQIGHRDSQQLLQLTGLTPKHVVDGVVEYTLSLAMVYVVMVSMLFFVWHVAAEKQSNFRHLLHVSGLSRGAYMLATAGADGVLQASLGMLLMVFIAGTLLEVRLVLWTSPVVLFVSLLVLAASGTTIGYLICLVCPSTRLASSAAQFVLAWVIFFAPAAPAATVVPAAGKQTWTALFLPVISAHRATFELTAACVKGRCFAAQDVREAFMTGRWAGPFAMLFGAQNGPEIDMTPAEAFISFLGMALVQIAIGVLLITILDRRQCPVLSETGRGQLPPETSAPDMLLEVKGLMHSYGWLPSRSSPETFTLHGVSFKIDRGETLGLLGPNGAGKTTAIRCITGEEGPQKGSVSIGAEAGGACIGLCPQETVINGDLTVAENLLFFAYVRGAQGDRAQRCVAEILRATRLEEKQRDLPDALSGGMRRRLAVGCAMIATPSVVVLDEPTTGLDPVSRRGIWQTIAEVKQAGGCCLLTTHMLEEAEYLSSHIVILRRGVVAAEGSVQALKNEWGQGYMLSIDSEESKEAEAQQFVSSLLDASDRTPVKSQRHGQATYKFSKDEESLGHLIIDIARGKAKHGIRHWGISQASLEDAYVRIIQQD